VKKGDYSRCIMYSCMENGIMRPVETALRRGKGDKGKR
jgi:hypothetical protein